MILKRIDDFLGCSENTMPCWYFDKSDLKKTPSIQDGVPAETENRYRREGPRFIFDMGTRLGLHHDTIATAVVFFHRFYVFHSFKKFPRYITATCCLFLAGKVEETPKKCRDLVKVARGLLSDAQFIQFGEDPREEVMTFERILLQTIKFDLQVEHPYKYMVQYAKALKGDRSKIEKLVQMAWTFINDSLCTSLCLQWEPQIVAVAVMYLAGRLCKFEPQDWAYNRGRWWEQFIDDISMDLLEDICHQVLDLYSHQKAKSSSSKTKRERPKTPADGDKSSEPQAKALRQDSKHGKSSESHAKQKPSTSSSSKSSQSQSVPSTSSQTSSKRQSSSQPSTTSAEITRQDSTNTEVVAMDTVETSDRGGIETHQESHISILTTQSTSASLPTKRSISDQSAYYSGVNQYQSFIGSAGEVPAIGMVPGRQYPHNFPAPPMYQSQSSSAFGSMPSTSQTPPALPRPGYSGPPPQTFQTSFAQPGYEHVPPGFPPSRFPPAPPNFGQLPPTFPPNPQHYPGTRGPMNPPGLATVRITGRRDQQGANQWV